MNNPNYSSVVSRSCVNRTSDLTQPEKNNAPRL